jgi:hypothetical protein
VSSLTQENSELYDLFSRMISQTCVIEPGARLAVVVYPSLAERPPGLAPGVVAPAGALAATRAMGRITAKAAIEAARNAPAAGRLR